MNENMVIASMVGGAFGAALVDLHAWSRATGNYDIGLAFRRWVAGGAVGIMAGWIWS